MWTRGLLVKLIFSRLGGGAVALVLTWIFSRELQLKLQKTEQGSGSAELGTDRLLGVVSVPVSLLLTSFGKLSGSLGLQG